MCSIATNKTSIGLSNIIKNKRSVNWRDEHGEELVTIQYIFQDTDERFIERKAKDYRKTYELADKFSLPLNIGGCDGNWHLFQEKVDILEEPDWSCIGRIWCNVYGKKHRFEEEDETYKDMIEDETYESTGIIKTDYDSEDNSSMSSFETFLDNQNADKEVSCVQFENDMNEISTCFTEMILCNTIDSLENMLDKNMGSHISFF